MYTNLTEGANKDFCPQTGGYNAAESSEKRFRRFSRLSGQKNPVNLANLTKILVLTVMVFLAQTTLAQTPNTDWYDDQGGASQDNFTISTDNELAGLRELVNAGNNFAGKTITLDDDIDLSVNYSAGWTTPIGFGANGFSGTFDGGNYVITGLVINLETYTQAGLFGRIDGGVVKNLGLEDVVINGFNEVGGVAGRVTNGTIENCYVTGAVTGAGNSVGGIAGIILESSNIENCYSTAEVSGLGPVGGIAGRVNGTDGSITNCAALNESITVTGTGTGSVGRIVGVNEAGALTDNIAWDGIAGTWSAGATGNDGEDKTIEELAALLVAQFPSITIPAHIQQALDDGADILAAMTAVGTATYEAEQANVTDIGIAKTTVEGIISGLNLHGATAVVNDVDFEPAISGTHTDYDGDDGSYTFTVTLTKGDGTPQTTGILSLTITATVYIPPVIFGNTATFTYTAAGVPYLLKLPPNASVIAELWGGGGGGGASDNAFAGGGGGGGGYLRQPFQFNAISQYEITVGTGGAGGIVDTDGSNGNNSSIRIIDGPTYTAQSGFGGRAAADAANGAAGVGGASNMTGSGMPIDVSATGSPGSGANGGNGGNSPNSGGSAGNSGSIPGGGGGGAINDAGISGSGGNGRAVITISFPTPSITAPAQHICDGGEFTIRVSEPIEGATYTWFLNDVEEGTGTTLLIDKPGRYVVSASYIYEDRNVEHVFPLESAVFEIEDRAKPVVTANANNLAHAHACPGGTFRATAIVPPGSYNFQWFLNDAPVGGDVQTYTINNLNNIDDYTLYVIATPVGDISGCDNQSNDVTLSIHANPVVTIKSDKTEICVNPSNTVTLDIDVIDFANEVKNESNFRYQWALNGVDISGATFATYYSPTLTTAGDYNYQLRIVQNDDLNCASVYSTAVTVNVETPLNVVIGGENIYCVGGEVDIFSTGVPTTGVFDYEWFRNDVSVGNNDNYTSNIQTASIVPYNYRLVVTSARECVNNSNTFPVTVRATPVVTATPNRQHICPGGTITFNSNVANAGGGLNYRWFLNNESTVVGFENQLSITNRPVGNYTAHLEVSSVDGYSGCEAKSAPVAFEIHDNPVITITSNETEICAGEMITINSDYVLNSDVANPNNFAYTWTLNGVTISGASFDRYTQTLSNPGMYRYSLRVVQNDASGCASQWSSEVEIRVEAMPDIELTADRYSYTPNESATLLANIVSPLGINYDYRWFVDGVQIPGQSSNTIISSENIRSTPYRYYVIVNSTVCEGTSSVINIFVQYSEVEIPSFFTSDCNDNTTGTYRTVHLPVTVLMGNPQTFAITFADATRASLDHTGPLLRNVSGDAYIDVRLPFTAGDYTLHVEIDGVTHATTGRVFLDSYAMGGVEPVEQRWSDVLVVNGNPANNGGYSFFSYQWYRNDMLLPDAIGQTYTETGGKLSGYYKVELAGYLQGSSQPTSFFTCPFIPSIQQPSFALSLYPVPVARNNALTFSVTLTADELNGSVLEIYDAAGVLKRKINNVSPDMLIDGFDAEGAYLGRLINRNGNVQTFKFIVSQ